MRSLNDLYLGNKATLLRLDLNVPVASRGEVRDDFKIRAAIPTIKALLDKGARLAIATHLGRPHGAVEERLSLANIGEILASQLGVEVMLTDDCVGDGVSGVLARLKKNEIILLENLRFNAGEVAASDDFAQELAAPFEAFVYDAFGCAHREHASIVKMFDLFNEKCLGPGMQGEIANVRSFFKNADEDDQLAVIVGGRSYAEKASLLQGMLDHTKLMLIGGGVASTLLAANGVPTGNNKVDKKQLIHARAFLSNAKNRGVEIVLPIDHKLAKKYAVNEPIYNSSDEAIADDTFAVDIGASTVALFKEKLAAYQRVIFCCPLGVSEWEHTATGSQAVAKYLVSSKKPAIFGGSELLYQIRDIKLPRQFMKCTAGNALLTLLAHGALPVLTQFSDPDESVLVS